MRRARRRRVERCCVPERPAGAWRQRREPEHVNRSVGEQLLAKRVRGQRLAKRVGELLLAEGVGRQRLAEGVRRLTEVRVAQGPYHGVSGVQLRTIMVRLPWGRLLHQPKRRMSLYSAAM